LLFRPYQSSGNIAMTDIIDVLFSGLAHTSITRGGEEFLLPFRPMKPPCCITPAIQDVIQPMKPDDLKGVLMLSLRSRFLLVGSVIGFGLAATVAADPLKGPAQPPTAAPILAPPSTALPLATVSQPSATLSIATTPEDATLPILPPDPAKEPQPAEKPQPRFLWYQKDYEPAPEASATAKTLAQFTSTFIAREGKHVAVFVHPWTKQPVRVWFTLPHGKWQVSHASHSVIFLSAQYGRVQIVFQPFGKVAVEKTSGGAFEGGG
jgi:hypothetical protein